MIQSEPAVFYCSRHCIFTIVMCTTVLKSESSLTTLWWWWHCGRFYLKNTQSITLEWPVCSQCCAIEDNKSSVYEVNWYFSRCSGRCWGCCHNLAHLVIFTIYKSFLMRYCMTLYLKGLQNYDRSNLKLLNSLDKSRTFKFDLSYFWYPFRVIQYLIKKLLDMVKMIQKG